MRFMTAIRVIFDGKAFIPQQPVSLPDQSEAMVIVEQNDPSAQAQLDAAVRAYYQSNPDQSNQDADDVAWGDATAPDSHKAWDED
ncbi:MAG: antitoxin family protein [Tepidisphaeraceae bacterium]